MQLFLIVTLEAERSDFAPNAMQRIHEISHEIQQALAGEKVPDKKSPLMEAYDILIPEAGKEGGE